MFDNKYPYTDFSQLNLDWFLLKFKDLLEEQERVSGKVKDLDDTVKEFTDFVTNYFDNLDVQAEVNVKLNEMAADGTLSDLLAPLVSADIGDVVAAQIGDVVDNQIDDVVADQIGAVVGDQIGAAVAPEIPGAVTSWLNDNVDPVGSAVVVDSTLSISGAAADAKAVGDKLLVFKTWTAGSDVKTVSEVGTYAFHASDATGLPSDFAQSSYAWLIVFQANLKILSESGTKNLWILTNNQSYWERLNTLLAQQTGHNAYVAMSQNAITNAITNEINSKQDGLQSVVDVIYSGNDDVFNVEGDIIQFGEDNENYLLNGITGADEPYVDTRYHLTKTTIQPNTCYVIKCSANYGNGFYAIFDSNDNLIKVVHSSGSGTTVDVLTTSIITPSNASYIKIAYLTDAAGYIKEMKLSYNNLKWKGLKWTAVGDSLTEVNSRTTKNYIDYIVEKTGITCVNMGLSGTGYARRHNTQEAFYDRVANVPTDSDVVTIFGSGNDLGAGLQLGDVTDTLESNTLCGFINVTIDRLRNVFLLAGKVLNIGIITPTPWVGSGTSTAPNAMSNYSDKIAAICKRKGIPCLNLYYCSNLDPDNTTFRQLAYSKDEGNGVHPDEVGHKLIAPRFEEFLSSLILS